MIGTRSDPSSTAKTKTNTNTKQSALAASFGGERKRNYVEKKPSTGLINTVYVVRTVLNVLWIYISGFLVFDSYLVLLGFAVKSMGVLSLSFMS